MGIFVNVWLLECLTHSQLCTSDSFFSLLSRFEEGLFRKSPRSVSKLIQDLNSSLRLTVSLRYAVLPWRGLLGHAPAPTTYQGHPASFSSGCAPLSSVLALATHGTVLHRQCGEHIQSASPVGRWFTWTLLMPNQQPWDVKAREPDTTFIWILTTFSLFVKHYDKIASCLGETAYQTFHQGRMTVKGTLFFFQDTKTQRQNLVGYKWADGQELTPRGGWRRSYQLRSWRHSVRLGFCSRSVSELGMKDWTIQPTRDLELHNADGFLQPKWEKNKTTWEHLFKAQLCASWLLLGTVS